MWCLLIIMKNWVLLPLIITPVRMEAAPSPHSLTCHTDCQPFHWIDHGHQWCIIGHFFPLLPPAQPPPSSTTRPWTRFYFQPLYRHHLSHFTATRPFLPLFTKLKVCKWETKKESKEGRKKKSALTEFLLFRPSGLAEVWFPFLSPRTLVRSRDSLSRRGSPGGSGSRRPSSGLEPPAAAEPLKCSLTLYICGLILTVQAAEQQTQRRLATTHKNWEPWRPTAGFRGSKLEVVPDWRHLFELSSCAGKCELTDGCVKTHLLP